MKKRLILHIGMHKTGTSSIQRFLSRNRHILRACGVFYPPSFDAAGRRQPKHNALFTTISHEADHGSSHPVLGSARDEVTRLCDLISASRCRAAIISAEGLSGERPIFAQALAPLKDLFDVQVHVSLRRYDDWAESFYKQMVLSREVREECSFAGFMEKPSTKAHLQFAQILMWWRDVFGADAVHAMEFRPGKQHGPVRQFISSAGLPKAVRWLPYVDAHENSSLPAVLIDVVRLANARKLDVDVTRLPQLLREIDDRSTAFLTLNQRKVILQKHAEDHRRLSNIVQLTGNSLFFTHHVNIESSRAVAWNEQAADKRSALLLPKLIKKGHKTKA